MKRFLSVTFCAALLTAGCAQQGPYGGGYGGGAGLPTIDKETVGTLVGGAGGAWAGSTIGKGSGKVVASVAGGLLGAFLGNQLGASLDATDRMQAERTAQRAFETARSSQPVAWSNPDSGNYGEVIPQQAYRDPTNGRTCRRYTQTIHVQGKAQKAAGTACRNPNGEWEIISNG